ncbi:MAG: glycosyltransferase family 2 protein [Candidatus Omnitrophica bacterium]|nr:glycosyltransferase family 2 protein [Candidatus Omnitrophota bacterium]
MKVPISVIVITKNEEARIEKCLKGVKDWAEEIIIVDDYSVDSTREIASRFTDKIFVRKMEKEGEHRNWAHTKAKYDWILSLDADEVLTEELKKEIEQIFNSKMNLEFSGFTIPRKNFIGNYWMRATSQYPAAQLKLFCKDKFRWEEVEVHPRAFLKGKCGHLKNPILHYTYRNFEDFLQKLNRQTTLEAQKWFNIYKINPKKANYKMNLIHACWRALDRFMRYYFVKKGYKDGFIGFMMAIFSSLYQLVSYAKYWELKNEGSISR